ncbi:hypothetical protein H2198_002154 [Neophaeococcomyces mojaviensis]|uniref:Uncharacterized protein n=1 Tax=Neophaeococcomyces mojaviensis TaxID=3383035 RepID=A0ACC3AFC2_9EURO|nr:hypothetical protein H2198_002154 [Knufia sp. JES_112]
MSGDESTSGQQASRRLKLVLKTSPLSTPVGTQVNSQATSKDGSSSPPRPSFSPVTPTGSHEPHAAAQQKTETQWIDEPPPLPLSLEDNADAIALKATISLLQMQRQQSLKDIRDLDKIKDAALEDPRGFADDLRTGKLKKPLSADITLDAIEYEDEEAAHDAGQATSKFGRLPNPQNIARCPPIEWSKYHIVGKPLDDMHEMQKRHPGVSESDIARGNLLDEHKVTTPYRPFKDKLDHKKQLKRQGN